MAELTLEKEGLDRKLTILHGEFQRSKEQSDTDIQRIQERAAIDQERAVLAAQREAMQEIGMLRDALAEAREEKALLKSELAQREGVMKAKRGRPAESK